MLHFENLKRPIDSPDCLDSRTAIYIEIGQPRRRQSDFEERLPGRSPRLPGRSKVTCGILKI
jgi:hypothetical protein